MSLYLISAALGLFICALIIVFFANKRAKRRNLARELNLKLLSIQVSQKTGEEKGQMNAAAWKEEVNKSAQLFGILTGLNTPFVLEAAVHDVGEEIHFYCAVPEEAIHAISRQIEGLWKEARVEPAEDYTIFSEQGAGEGVYIRQRASYGLPIRTYEEANLDTFASILSGLSKINEQGEGAAIQIIGKPAGDFARKNIMKMIMDLKKGKKTSEILQKGISIEDFKKIILPEKKPDPNAPKIIDEDTIQALEMKLKKPLLSINARLVVSTPKIEESHALLQSMSPGFGQFVAPFRQELQVIKPKNQKKLLYQFAFREFDPGQAMIVNTEELASFFHMPTDTTAVPKVKWLKSKEAPVPVNLPQEGTLVGEGAFRGEHKKVYITEDDRRRHVYIIGQTGTGKSTLVSNMVIDDIYKGKGVAIIDPHGELIETILSTIPRERVEDVIVFDPADREYPLGMNMLEYDFEKPEEKTFIVNELFNILDKLYDMKTVGGPMFEQYTKNAILLLMEDMPNEPATLMEIPRVFTDEEYRKRKLARITNPVVIDFWEKEALQASGEHSLANMAPYITSKFNNFIANDYVRPIIGQPKSAFNFREIMDGQKIFLVNLSKGKIGDSNANLLGMVITGKILMAALSRVDIRNQNERKDFSLFIDEFQNFATESIATILSEARKYRLNIVMAHQFIAQLTDKIRDAVFGNVGNIISFRVGAPDAEVLVKQFEPVFSQNDLVNIDNRNAYVKMLVHGATTKPFNIRTLPPEKGNEEYVDKIKELSALKYGHERETVEQEILSRMRN